MKLKGKIDIHKYHSSLGGSGVSIAITDESSRTQCVYIDMTIEAFAQAMFGLSHQECTFEIRNAEVGKKHENKTEIVPFECKSYDREALKNAAKIALKPFEVDGWSGSIDDLMNHHRRVGSDNSYRVSFHRYVDGETKEAK